MRNILIQHFLHSFHRTRYDAFIFMIFIDICLINHMLFNIQLLVFDN